MNETEQQFELELKEFLQDLGNRFRMNYKVKCYDEFIHRRHSTLRDKSKVEFKAIISIVKPELK